MTKLFFAAALTFGALTTGPAHAASIETLTHEGVRYEYSVTQNGKTQVIEGLDRTNHRPFRLLVADGWVKGTVDGSPVSFPLSSVKHVVADAETPADAVIAAR